MSENINPQKTYALVVGVEKYEAGSNWNLNGPAQDAGRFIRWLLDRQVPAANITLFSSALDETALSQKTDNLPFQAATRQNIQQALTKDLPQKDGDLLFVFWGGHGIITPENSRRLFYTDATSQNMLNLDLNQLFTFLRSDYFSGFGQQVWLVDTCANYIYDPRQEKALPSETFPAGAPRTGIEQFILLAARPGEIAKNLNAEKTGLFSKAVLEELAQASTAFWPPDLKLISGHLEQKFVALREQGAIEQQTPLHFWYRDWKGNEHKYGAIWTSQPINRRPCPSPPPAPEQFGGRDDELLDLKNRMKAGEAIALTAVKGLGGIGKTTVARQLASDLYYKPDEKIFQAVLWKEVKRKPDPLRLLLDWAYSVEPAFLYKDQSQEQLVQQVKAMLENLIAESCGQASRTLVVFDDVWDDGIEAVRLLKQACPNGATVLITTRSGKVGVMLAAQEYSLDKLDPDRGVKLLLEYLPDADPVALRQLAVVLDGHPLAMTIAAKRVRLKAKHRQAEALLEHIAEYEKGLPAGTSFAELKLELSEEKEDNLTKALYFSYAELNLQEQGYFRKLGILPYNAPFDDGMLVAIWKLEAKEVEEPCDRLRLLSLLDSDEMLIKSKGGNWYRQHPLVQSYARALLKQ
jgi:hypothetical protein